MRSKYLWFFTICLFFIGNGDAWAYRVAVFDFDDRLDEPNTVARYIETQLTQTRPDIVVEQFTGKGDEVYSVEVLSSLDSAGYDLIITVTSDALIIAHHTLTRTPTLYTNVNNPLFLGIRSLGPPGGNISGASYYVPIEKQLRTYQEIQPDLRRPGFIFDMHNKSRKAELPEARETCMRMGLAFEIEIIESPSQLPEKVQRLIDRGVDAVITTSSGTIYKHIGKFLDIADQADIPIYSFNKEGVKFGAVAALASDYFLMVDRLLIPMALRVLDENISPGKIPAAFLHENMFYLNIAQANKLNLVIHQSLLDRSTVLP